MITTMHTEALRLFEVQQSELDRDLMENKKLRDRYPCLVLCVADSQQENAPLQVAPQNSEHDFLKQHLELQSYTATL